MKEFTGVLGRLHKAYREKRQESEDLLVDFAEKLADQYVDDVKGKVFAGVENLNYTNQKLVELNVDLIEHVGVAEEGKKVSSRREEELLKALGEADKKQKQSEEECVEVGKTLDDALQTVEELKGKLEVQGKSLKELGKKFSNCERGEDELWQTAAGVAERLTVLVIKLGKPMRDTNGLQRNFGIHGVFSHIHDSLSHLEALGDVVKDSEKTANNAWDIVKEVQEKEEAKQVELDTTKKQEAEARGEVEKLKSDLAKDKGEMTNLTNTLKSVEEERDSLKSKLGAVEVEEKSAKRSLTELRKKVEEAALEEGKGDKADCCAPLLAALARKKVEVAGLNRRLGTEGAQQKPSNVRRAKKRQARQEERRSSRAGEEIFGRVGGVKRREDRSEGSSPENSRRKVNPEVYLSYSKRRGGDSSERHYRFSDRSDVSRQRR